MSQSDIVGTLQLLMKYARSAHHAVAGVDYAEFVHNDILYDAVIKRLELVGETARRLPVPPPADLPKIPVSQMIGMRNILAHRYERTDLEIVYQAAREEMPKIAAEIERWLKERDLPMMG